jgi:sucrose-6-phosphate hydrolase SacC (GH32 family)
MPMAQKRLSSLMAVAMLFGSIVNPSSAAVAADVHSEMSNSSAVTENVYGSQDLILRYDMTSSVPSGDTLLIKNVSGNVYAPDGILKNRTNGRLVSNGAAGFASFAGGSATSGSGYIEIPKMSNGTDVLNGLNEITVSSLVQWPNDGENRWIFGFGTTTSNAETGNKYFFTTPRHGINNTTRPVAAGISKAGWRNEALVAGASMLPANTWKQVTTVFSEQADTISVYVDGVRAASGSAKGIKLQDIIDPNAAYSGFIGKSIFAGDAYLKGQVSDFRVYKRAFSNSEVSALYTEAAGTMAALRQLTIEDARNLLDLRAYLGSGDKELQAVTQSLRLPAAGEYGASITWSTDRPEVITSSGTVTRPPASAEDARVKLTAQLTYEGLRAERSFEVTVLKQPSTSTLVTEDLNGIVIPHSDQVKGNLHLPTLGKNGSSFRWTSSHPEVIKGSDQAEGKPDELGWVTRPAADTQVQLTATAVLGEVMEKRVMSVTVKQRPEPLQYDAYFFAYFTGEYEGGEEISFATAEEPLHWRSLNNGKSILKSELGEKGLRDPFILRSPEGDKFYMLATDLKMGESTNFDQAQITGSHYIMVWESDDLVNWSKQRMVEVAPKKGGNTWAPEAFYDKNTGNYLVFWASSMKVEDTYGKYPSGRPAGQYNVMYYATTRDFYTFSEPKVYIDDAHPTIDTTMLEQNGTLYRFTKSEVGYKVYYEKAPHPFYDKDGVTENGYQFEPVAGTRDGIRGLIGHGGNNEGPTVFKDLREEKWYMFLDSWPYHVRVSTNLEDGAQFVNNLLPDTAYALPPGPRHGTVIPISRAEYQALQAAYGVPAPASSVNPVVHYSFDPEHVTGTAVKDLSGNGYDAVLMGGSTIVTGDKIGGKGGSVELNGTSGYVELPVNMIRRLNLKNATISAWVKTDASVANQRIFDFASPTGRTVNRNTMYLSTQGDSGGLEFAIVTPFTEKFANETTPLSSSYKYALRAPLLAPNGWQHVAVAIGEFDAVLYVNGKEAARSSTYNAEPRMLLDTAMNYLGRSSRNGHAFFDGKLDDFRIYNRALSPDEVAALVNVEVPGPGDQPIGPKQILHYDMSQVEGTTVKDAKGTYHATWVNPQNAEWIHTTEASALSFVGGSTASYLDIPKGVLDGLSDVTVSSIVSWKGEREAEWLFALGQNSDKYMFFTPKRNSGDRSARFGLGVTSWRNEAGANATTGTLKNGEWKLVTAVMSGKNQTLTLYIDGAAVATGSTLGYTLPQINNGNGRSGYIGKSFYSADPYFGGMIADFEVYDGALTAGEVAKLKTRADEKIAKLDGLLLQDAAEKLDESDILGKNTSKDEVKLDLSLPSKGEHGIAVSWTTSNAAVISNEGKVQRPSYEEGNQTVLLQALLSDGQRTLSKTFAVTVLRKPKDSDAVLWDAEALLVHNIHDVRGHLTLPVRGENGSHISWSSEQPALVSSTGEVSRPAHGIGDQLVKLTAAVTMNDARITKQFLAVVREMPASTNYAGYMFAYFTGEGYASGEQIYFALSEGNNALQWKELNGGNPVITSDMGEKGLRDPFIIRSPEGDKFYMIATDLKIYGNGDWTRAQTNGSRSIMVWESNDLIHWSKQRMVEVSPPEAGNTWAPEAFYDKSTGEYVVFWASKLYPDESRSGSTYQKMVYTKTRDFYTFTEPKVYMDYGYSIIDTTMIEHADKVYRITKDERNTSTSTPNGKYVFQEAGDNVFDQPFAMIKEGIGKGAIARGEGPTIFKSNTEEKWYLFIDEFGGRGYVPFETTNLSSGNWTMPSAYQLPARPRHGTVIPVTQSEYNQLQTKVPVIVAPSDDIRVTGISMAAANISLYTGQQQQLQAEVAPASAANKRILWSSSNESIARVDDSGQVTAAGTGMAYISAATADGGYLAVTAVKVEEDSAAPVTNVSVLPTQPDGSNGWYTQRAAITFAASDVGSGVLRTEQSTDGMTWTPITGILHLDAEGRHSVYYRSIDQSGNIEAPQLLQVNIDKTGPAIAIANPVDGSFVDYTASDEVSGIDPATVKITLEGRRIETGAVIDFYKLPFGDHIITVTAADLAGNVNQASVTLRTEATLDGLQVLVRKLASQGDITNEGITRSLLQKLNQGAKGIEPFTNEVQAQKEKHITKEAADLLLRFAEAIR